MRDCHIVEAGDSIVAVDLQSGSLNMEVRDVFYWNQKLYPRGPITSINSFQRRGYTPNLGETWYAHVGYYHYEVLV